MPIRNPFEPRKVVSRRGGRVKQPLSHDVIVDTALEILGQHGLDGMSLRSVAKALDTGPASLYVYVDDLQQLHALVLDRALARVSLRSAEHKPWQERLHTLLASYYQVLAQCPGLAQLALSTIAAGPNALRLLEVLLGVLDDAGVPETTAAWATDLLMLYVTAIAFEQTQRATHGDPLGHVAAAVSGVSPDEFPRVHRVREALLSGGKARFTWALQVMLEGILRVPLDKSALTRGKARSPR